MSVREVPLTDISTELLRPREIAADSDPDHPLVVIEDGGRLLLVDGFKRFFALKARGEKKTWVIQKGWTRAEAKLHRLRFNNPTRRTTLREELDLLDDIRSKEELSVHAIFRGLGKKKSWVEKRLAVLERLSPEAADLIPDPLFTVTVAQGIAALPADEQVATTLAIQEAKLHLDEAIRFLKLLGAHDGPDRARLPRKEGKLMIKPEIRDRVLKLKQAGKSIRWIARHQQISRRNVRRILRGVPVEEKTPEKRPSLLDPFRQRIKDMVEEGMTAALIFRRIGPQGYAGGRTILDDYLRSLRGPRHEKRAFARFETLPAEESQQDWSPY